MILVHGTTRDRARSIIRDGPNPRFREPSGQAWNDGFSMYVKEAENYMFLPPERYAENKAKAFPTEGGPVILEVDVPNSILDLVSDWFPIAAGLVQFDEGAGLEELLDAWPHLKKTIVDLA